MLKLPSEELKETRKMLAVHPNDESLKHLVFDLEAYISNNGDEWPFREFYAGDFIS